ncbi:transcriptional regulator DEF1 [Drosophila obscura]|uniref:transcriptional regulator DEF1 n=1 Tax=Drosophila obscura TaxID=7282 RepID=UPI001BB253E4|nr:transcriptional regulator DEF1 [Drosophila obscura]
MPQQGKNELPGNVRRTVFHTDLQTLQLPRQKPPEQQQKPTSIQDLYPSPPPPPYQNVPQHQNMQQMMQQPHDKQTRKNTPKMMQQNQQTKYQNPPKKDPYEGPPLKANHDQLNQQPPQGYRVSAYQNCTENPTHGNPQIMQQPPQQSKMMRQCHSTEYQNPSKKDPYIKQLQQEYREECFCISLKQLSHSNHSQKQLFSNDPQEQVQRNLSQNKAPARRCSSMAKVVPVPRTECNSRQVPHNLCRNADSRPPSFMADKAKEIFSPEGCDKDNHKMGSKGKLSKYENQLSGTESNCSSTKASVISAKSGDELRSMVLEELKLQLALRGLSNMVKKGEILDPEPSTCDKSASNRSKSFKSKEKASTSACAALETGPQVDYSNDVDEIVKCKVITPMIRKIQKTYLKNLRDEIDLVEYLERVPAAISELCKNAGIKDQSKLKK